MSMRHEDLELVGEKVRKVCPNVHDVTIHDDETGAKRISCAFVVDEYGNDQQYMDDITETARVLREAGLAVDRPTSVNQFGATFVEGRTEQ